MKNTILRRLAVFALTLFMIVPSVTASVAGTNPAGDASASEEDVYAVPLNLFLGGSLQSQGASTDMRQLYTDKQVWNSATRVQFNDYAMVTEKPDGTYRVKLQFYSYSAVDAIQIVDPAQVEAVKQTYPYFCEMPMGTYNLSGEALLAACGTGLASSDANGYYLQGQDVEISQGNAYDTAMEFGYVSFDVPNLDQMLLMKTYSTAANLEYNHVFGHFQKEQAVRIPRLTKEGEYPFGFYTSNFASSTASHSRNNSTSNARLYTMLDKENGVIAAQVGNGGGISLTADVFKQQFESQILLGIQRPTSRNGILEATTLAHILDENYNAVYSAVELSENRVFSYNCDNSYEDLVFGKPFWFTHNTQARIDAGSAGYNSYFFLHLLPLDDVEYEEEIFDPLSSNGLTLIPGTGGVSDDAVLSALEYKNSTATTLDKSTFESYAALAADDSHYKAYHVSFANGDGAVEPTGGAKLVFSVPDGWGTNLSQIKVLSKNLVNNPTVSYTDHTIAVTISSSQKLNADFLFVDAAKGINPLTAIAEDGVYKVSIAYYHGSQSGPSMANGYMNNYAYLERKDGVYNLYMNLVKDGATYGSVNSLAAYGNGHGNGQAPIPSEVLEYWTDSAGNLGSEPFSVRRAVIELKSPESYNGYAFWVQFYIPGMASIEGISGYQDARLLILNTEKIESGINPLAGYDKSVISVGIADANRLLPELEASAAGVLSAAIAEAHTAYGAEPATDESILSARNALAAAVAVAEATLEPEESEEPTVDTTALTTAIAEAKNIVSDGYVAGSYEALTAAITAAEAALLSDGLTETQIAAQIAALKAVEAALVSEDDTATESFTVPLYDKTSLWNFTTPSQPSMSHAAVDHSKSYLMVEDEKAKVHLFFGSVSVGNMQGYLRSFAKVASISPDSEFELIPATVHSYHEYTDEFNENEGWFYPYEVSIEVTPYQEITDVYVNVPVMGVAANQPAILKINWDGVSLTGETPDFSALQTALSNATAVDSSDYTSESYAALTASKAAGEALIVLDGATQTMANARTAAITAAIAALIPATGDNTPEPEQGNGTVDIVNAAVTNNTATVTLMTSEVQTALNNTNANVFTVNVAAGDDFNALAVTLPAEAAAIVKNAGLPLTVTGEAGRVTLSAATVAQVTAGTDDLTILIGAAGAGALNAAQEATVGESAVYDLGIRNGNAFVTDNFNGTVTVSLPYAYPASVTVPADYDLKVYYLDDNGTGAYISDATYANGFATFIAPHFSLYYIAAEAKNGTGTPGEDPAGSVTLGLKGASSVKAGTDVVYEVTVANTTNLGNLTFNVRTTDGLTFKSAAASNGVNLYSDANSSAVTLGFFESGLTSTGETAVLRLTFTANASGSASVTLTDIGASGIVIGENGSPESHWYDVSGTYTFGVTVKDDLIFDVNGDDKEDMLDLTLAQYYYQLTSASPLWDARADKVDQNSDGLIDLGDLIKIYIAVKAAS
jgi:hypothetical protein